MIEPRAELRPDVVATEMVTPQLLFEQALHVPELVRALIAPITQWKCVLACRNLSQCPSRAIGRFDIPARLEQVGGRIVVTAVRFDPVDVATTHWSRSGEIGILRLGLINTAIELDSALDALRDTGGLVLSGIPGFGPSEIAGRLIDRELPGSVGETPVAFPTDLRETAWVRGSGKVRTPRLGKRSQKPVVILVNGAMQSSAERLVVTIAGGTCHYVLPALPSLEQMAELL